MTPLAEAVYDVLRRRVGQADPRISYAELVRAVRDVDPAFDHVTHRSRELYSSLGEVHDACGRLGLPTLAALVVRADTRRPGDAYFEGMPHSYRGERIAEWQRELEAVSQSTYPPRD